MRDRKRKTISKILKLKEGKKKEMELKVKKAADRLDEVENEIQNLQNDYESKVKFFNENSEKGALDVSNVNSYYDFFIRINGKINEQKKVQARRKAELKLLKESLVNAHKDEKVFEILNEKAVKADRREKALSEQKETDFIAISRRVK